MESKTVYVTKDKKEFNSKDEALIHENMIERVEEIMSALGERPQENFSNGAGYIQHDASVVTKINDSFYELACDKLGFAADDKPSFIMLGRFLADNNSYLYGTWSRLQCIDHLNREWDQPYFAINPTKGTQVEIKL